MLDWISRAIKKYQRGLCVTGVIAGSVVTLGYICKQKLLSWRQLQLATLLQTTHIDQHTLQHYHNTTSTLTGFVFLCLVFNANQDYL